MSAKSVIVIGLGKFGASVAAELDRNGAEVLAIDVNEEATQSFANEHSNIEIKQCDIRDNAALANLGISNMDAAVIAITGNMDASIIATMYTKEQGVPYIVAKAKDETHSKILKKLGADKVIIPEHTTGIHAAQQILTGHIIDYIELSKEVRMIEIPPRKEWTQKSLKELNLRKKENINIIAIRNGSNLSVNVDPDTIITNDCSLLVTVEKKYLGHLLRN